MPKQYTSPADPAKVAINKLYAATSRQWVKRPRHLILDTKHAVTTKALISYAVPPKRIHAPNINLADCKALRALGVDSPHANIEATVTALAKPPNCLWYDSMTTVGGNARLGHYPFAVVDQFLIRNQREIRHRCVVALTLSVRNNQLKSVHGTNTATAIRQLRALATHRGFVVHGIKSTIYKQNMMFLIALLRYDPVDALGRRAKLLSWKGNPARLIGFAP